MGPTFQTGQIGSEIISPLDDFPRLKQTQNRKFGNVSTRTESIDNKTMQKIYNVLHLECQVS